MKNDPKHRRQLERDLANAFVSVISIGDELELINSSVLIEFLKAWQKLVRYYQRNDDAVIGIDVVSVYLSFREMLNNIISDVTKNTIHEKARELYQEIEGYIDEIRREGLIAVQIEQEEDH